MPTSSHSRISPTNGFTGGQTTTWQLGTKTRLLALIITPTGTVGGSAKTTATDLIKEARMVVNGTPLQRYTGAQIDMLNNLYGDNQAEDDAGGGQVESKSTCTLHFAEPHRKTLEEANLLSWSLGNNVRSCNLEIEWVSGASQINCNVLMVHDFPVDANGETPILEAIKTLYNETRPISHSSGTAVVEVNGLTTADAYESIFLELPANTVLVDYEVEHDNRIIRKGTLAELQATLEHGRHFSAVGEIIAGRVYPIVFGDTLRAFDSLPMVRANGTRIDNFKLRFNITSTVNAPSTLNLFIHRFGSPKV